MYKYRYTSLSFIFFLLSALPLAVHAETHITAETVFGPIISWTREGSPYILDDDIFLPAFIPLAIGPGVTIQSGNGEPHALFVRNTDVRINGSAEEPVAVNGLSSIYIMDSTAHISHMLVNTSDGISFFMGTTTLSSSTITGADIAISAHKANLSVQDSVITANKYGLYSFYTPAGPVLSRGGQQYTGGEGNMFEDDPGQNHISISNSVIAENTTSDVFNETSNSITADHNWWGTDTGPGALDIYGPVDVIPWLTKDPGLPSQSPVCCSNVLFLPGVEASRLYVDQSSILGDIFGTSTNQLWEPNRNADARKLFMDSNGKSINPGIYTKDIIDSVFGFGIYKKFIAMMDGMIADGKINKWQAFPYDWRLSIDNIVTPQLINTLQVLASSSKTGKATIVAHSNGGLVAKMLMKTLQEQGKASLVDKLFLVTVPELGTPQAVASLLHGDGQEIAGGLFLSKSTARQMGQNMPGAYSLLPSKEYFSNMSQPIISFGKSSLAGIDFSAYGSITTQSQPTAAYTAFRAFLGSLFDRRPTPSLTDTWSPSILHTSMIDASQHIHDALDRFIFSTSTPAISLIGWGKKTLIGIKYDERSVCLPVEIAVLPAHCSKALTFTATTTPFGDGTVAATSAVVADSKDYYIDLANSSADHSTIFNDDSVLSFVREGISTSSVSSLPGKGNNDPFLKIPRITDRFPTMADVKNNNLTVTIHSPVELNIYDSQGRHTGPIVNPDPTSDIGRYELGIPGSEFHPDDDENTYITVPFSGTYRVELTGTGIGTFSVDTEHEVNGNIVAKTTFADLPVTPLLRAELDLTPVTATSAQILQMDTDGDGVIDATSTPHGHVNMGDQDLLKDKVQKYLQLMRTVIIALHLPPQREKAALLKIETISDLIKKGKKIKISKKWNEIMLHFQGQHWVFKKTGESKKHSISNDVDGILESISEDK